MRPVAPPAAARAAGAPGGAENRRMPDLRASPLRRRRGGAALPLLGALLAASLGAAGAAAADERPGLEPCWLPGVEHRAWCGRIERPLDPDAPQGTRIQVHYAVVPALARQRLPDPVFFLAGGPGQSAIDLAGPMARLLSRSAQRRDLVFVDQRGTGRNAALACDAPPAVPPVALLLDTAAARQRLQACRERLQSLPHGDLRFYTTTVAMQDLDAVRAALGAPQINLVGGSYGTRAALEYQRQFPQRVRRLVIDGVAPPDMALPEAFAIDNQAALDQVYAACAADAGCAARHPRLQADWRRFVATLPRAVDVTHPATGRTERVTLQAEAMASLLRAPLYAPALAAALPDAMGAATQGRIEPLVALASALGGGPMKLAEGQHFSVICAEDMRPAPAPPASATASAPDFGRAFSSLYREVCAGWPRGDVPEGFYTMPRASGAALVLSGGADPVTPPRHGERAARALGAKARHVLVPQAGHGVLGIGCTRDLVHRFIAAETDVQALQFDAACLTRIPRPPVFTPLAAASAPETRQP